MQRSEELHPSEDVLARVAVSTCPTALAAGEGHVGARAMHCAVEAEIEAQALRGIHDIGGQHEADDDVGPDFGEGPVLAPQQLREQVYLRVVEDVVVVRMRDAREVFAQRRRNAYLRGELDAVPIAAVWRMTVSKWGTSSSTARTAVERMAVLSTLAVWKSGSAM